MKKIVISIAIIVTAVTAKVGYSEFKEWKNEKQTYETWAYQHGVKLEAGWHIWDNYKTEEKTYSEPMNKGFWRSIFNAFSK